MAQIKQIPASFQVTHDMLAEKGRRFLNYIIDVIAVYIVIFILAVIAAFIAVVFKLEGVITWMQQVTPLESYSIAFCVILLYFGIFETTSARTLGKLITGTKVVMADTGEKPTAQTILKRSLCRLIPFEAFSFFGGDGTGWHDRFTGTAVVIIKRFEAGLQLHDSFEELGNTSE